MISDKGSWIISYDSDHELDGSTPNMEEKKFETKSNNTNIPINVTFHALSKPGGLNNNGKEYFCQYKNYGNNNNDDAASMFGDRTRFTEYVSTFASFEYELNDALVAMIGVCEYDVKQL